MAKKLQEKIAEWEEALETLKPDDEWAYFQYALSEACIYLRNLTPNKPLQKGEKPEQLGPCQCGGACQCNHED